MHCPGRSALVAGKIVAVLVVHKLVQYYELAEILLRAVDKHIEAGQSLQLVEDSLLATVSRGLQMEEDIFRAKQRIEEAVVVGLVAG